MSTAAPTNYDTQPMAVCDLLYSKTDWVIGDLINTNDSPFIGADGTRNSVSTSLTLFDFRPYRSVQAFMYFGGFSGGTSPNICFTMYGYDNPVNPGFIPVSQADTQLLTSAGGAMMILGEGGATVATNTGAARINDSAVTYTYRVLFGLPEIKVTGSPTGLTSLRFFIYGLR